MLQNKQQKWIIFYQINNNKKKILWVSVKFAVIMRQRFNPSQDKSLICNK